MGALMARKDLLKGLMGQDDPPAPSGDKPRVDIARPRYGGGAIGAVSKSIADLKARSVVELDPFDISDTGLRDRLEHDPAEEARLAASIRDHGQQVPVLVRPDPQTDGKYLIVYGRRRVLALRDLGQPVKAMIRDLDDETALLAQGQENTARRDLSFVEKANFARQMVAAGYDRKIVCDALSVDKTVISRMLSITERLPLEIIEHVGAAPGIGRDRWLDLAQAWEARKPDVDTALAMIATAPSPTSDSRFETLAEWLSRSKPPRAAPRRRSGRVLADAEGHPLATMTQTNSAMTLKIHKRNAQGFDTWLAEHIAEIHRDWLASRGN
jgi:ParB family chromosome partitioning protein